MGTTFEVTIREVEMADPTKIVRRFHKADGVDEDTYEALCSVEIGETANILNRTHIKHIRQAIAKAKGQS